MDDGDERVVLLLAAMMRDVGEDVCREAFRRCFDNAGVEPQATTKSQCVSAPPRMSSGTQADLTYPPNDKKAVIEAILGGASVKSQDKSEWEEGFREDFWKLYPRKVGKPGASRAWMKLMPERLEEQQGALDEICSGLGRWVEYWREHETPEDKIPHPATFLNDHRHEDFPS